MYDTNELLPVVARLTKRYTGIESSSVTYEKANQLMGAVIYCIREIESGEAGALVSRQQNAMQAYQAGADWYEKRPRSCFVFTSVIKRSSVHMEMFIFQTSGTKECQLFLRTTTSSLSRRIQF